MTRLLCTGDLHLGKGAQYADDRLADQREVWERILRLADEEECDAILFAGDAFEGPLPTPEHYQAFTEPIHLAQMNVLAITGNGRHDAAMRSTSALEVPSAIGLEVMRTPQIVEWSGVTVACLPWASTKHLVARRDGGERDRIHDEAAEHLLTIARDLRERCPAGEPAVLLTHFSISGAALPNGLPVDQLREPLLDLTALEELGFDAVIAGHIHKAQHLSDDSTVFYVGSPLPLDFGEADYQHGVWILDTESVETFLEFRPIESRPFVTLDDDGAIDEDPHCWLFEPYAFICGAIVPDGAVVRVRYRATEEQARRIDQREIRQSLLAAGAHRVFIQPNIVRAERARVAAIDETVDEREAFDLWLDSLPAADPGTKAEEDDAVQRAHLLRRHADYLEAVA